MKHLEIRRKYSAARRIFNSPLVVSSGDETLRLMHASYITSISNSAHYKNTGKCLTIRTALFMFL